MEMPVSAKSQKVAKTSEIGYFGGREVPLAAIAADPAARQRLEDMRTLMRALKKVDRARIKVETGEDEQQAAHLKD
jgi:hypothetical protein